MTETISASWTELFRTNDRREALVIVTTIAAMEFDVRWRSQALQDELADSNDDGIGGPPYIIETNGDQWQDLIDVVEAIREEQAEFDQIARDIAARRDRTALLITVGLIVGPVALTVLDAVADSQP